MDSDNDDDWLITENDNAKRIDDIDQENVKDKISNDVDDVDDIPLAKRWDNFIKNLTWSKSETFTPTIHEFKNQHIGVQNCIDLNANSTPVDVFYLRIRGYDLCTDQYIPRKKNEIVTRLWKVADTFQNTRMDTII